MAEEMNKLGLHELIEKVSLADEDILVIQDLENTKRITFRNLRDSLIEDNEAPSIHRMYSSEKLNTAIEAFQKQLDEGIGRVRGDIDDIAAKYITEKYVDDKIDEFSKTVPELVDVETIRTALESKRNNTDKITCNDIETGEDEKKIQLRNLSSAVLSYMTGETPLTPPAAPEGGWTQEYIANGSINGTKLAKQYRYRGHYPEGDINQFTNDGLYLLGSSVEGLPKYDEFEDDDRLLEVFNYGPNQYIIQKLSYASENGEEVRPIYYRKCLLNRLAITPFIAEYPVTDTFKLTRNTLHDNILDMGVIESGDVYDLTEDGDYLVKKGVKNLPNAENDFTVSVRKYDTRVEYTAKSVNLIKCEIYVSNTYLSSNGAKERTQWYLSNNASKSRLDGKRVHLFGDGVCYGMGSSNIIELAYPALLSSRYGLIINNCALPDASIGEYGDEHLSERSVLMQIESSTLDNTDFAIIFAGSEDYKSGLGKIGSNTSDTGYTFKGALNLCIQKLLQKKPDIKVLIVSPLFRARLGADDFRNSDQTQINELYLRDYCNAMKEVCEFNHIPFLDLHSTSMINKYNFEAYLSDRLNLNDAGHDMIANKIFSALNNFY